MSLSTKQYLLLNAGVIQSEAPTTGSTVTADNVPINNIDITPLGLLATLTIEFNDTPEEGHELRVLAFGFGVTSLTLDGNGNTVIGALTSLTVGVLHIFKFIGGVWRKIT